MAISCPTIGPRPGHEPFGLLSLHHLQTDKETAENLISAQFSHSAPTLLMPLWSQRWFERGVLRSARQHIEGSDRTRFTRTKKRGCAYIRSHQLDLVVISNDGALRHQRPLRFAYGGAGGLSQGETGDFLSIMTIYSARPQERPMRTHRFGRKIKLPATIAIKHQIRMRMAQYEVKKAEAEARAEVFRGQTDDNPSMSSSSVTTP